MTYLQKKPCPPILWANRKTWLREYLRDRTNKTKKFRYRHPQIKLALIAETFEKCAYCESKVGHNCPGDVEHKFPSSKRPNVHFSWKNLTIACPECNRRKNDYLDAGKPFIDPYKVPDPLTLRHIGPIVHSDDPTSKITLGILELNDRMPLVLRKIERISATSRAIDLYQSERNPILKELAKQQVLKLASPESEYSAMVRDYLKLRGFPL